MIFKMDEKENRMFRDLHKLHLRHPGMVSARVLKLLYRPKSDTYSDTQMQVVRLEWLRLCPPPTSPVSPSHSKGL
jgi:hypothetical protein